MPPQRMLLYWCKICRVPAIPIITGTGLVTALGRSVNDTWQSLLAGRFITTSTRLETRDANMPRVISLAIEAAEEAVAQAGWSADPNTAVIASTSKGSVESWLNPLPSSSSDKQGVGRRNPSFGLADLSTVLARRFGFVDGPRANSVLRLCQRTAWIDPCGDDDQKW